MKAQLHTCLAALAAPGGDPEVAGSVLRVELEPIRHARGRVTRDGRPVEGARVWFACDLGRRPGAPESVRTFVQR